MEFEKARKLYGGHVRRLALRLARDPDDAADIEQEAWIRAYRAWDKFRGESCLATWLYRIVTNVNLDRVRRTRKRPTVRLDDLRGGENLEFQLVDGQTDLERDLLTLADLEVLRIAFARLPHKLQRLLDLRYIDQLSYEELAEKLDLPIGTVKSRINRARNAIKRLCAA